MGRKPKAVEIDAYTNLVYNQMNRNDILKEYRKVAKRMNQRIVTLEKAGLKMPKGEASKFLESQGKTRFQERLTKYEKGKSDNQLRKELMIMHRFEESKQSTIKGRKETRKKIHDTLMEKTLTPSEQQEYESLKTSSDKKDRKKRKQFEEQHKLSDKLVDKMLIHINDLKGKMAWEYEKAVEMTLELIKDEPTMSESKLEKVIDLAVSTRNERQFKKLLDNKSLTDYDSFSTAFTRVFGGFRVRKG